MSKEEKEAIKGVKEAGVERKHESCLQKKICALLIKIELLIRLLTG